MLQSMRESARSWVTFVVVGIIAFMMAITGLETIIPSSNNPDVATVNGEGITRAQLVQSMEQQRRTIMQRMGDQFDPSLISDEQLRESVLNSLIERTLLLQEARAGGMDVGSEELDAMIVVMPEFQQDGQFNQDRFLMMVRSLGMSPLEFHNLMRNEVVLTQLQAGVVDSEFVTRQEIEQLNLLEHQKRDVAWLTLIAAAIREVIDPTEEEIIGYYQENQSQFMSEEQVIVDYVELDKAVIAEAIEISEQDLRDEYERRLQDIEGQPAEMTVSTILLQTGDQRSADEAETLAKLLIAQMGAGEDFAKLAKEYSDDPVTSIKGGDMGVVHPGFFGDAFDDALAILEVGQVSEPVVTDFGVQLLKLTSKKVPALPAYPALKESIESDLKLEEAESLYLDQVQQLADISFESADLVQPAEQLGLKIKTIGPFSRQGGEGLGGNPKMVAAAFSDDVINLGANSEVIDLSTDKAIVVRAKKHLEPKLKAVDEVNTSIVEKLKSQQAHQQLKEKAAALMARLESGETLDQVAQREALEMVAFAEVSRSQKGIPRQLLAKAFKMPRPESGHGSFDSVDLSNGDVAVIALNKVVEGDVPAPDKDRDLMIASFIARGNGGHVFTEYLASLKSKARIEKSTQE